ncbi:MAG: DUF192 domain-containing protein [Selenomonadales bacterium]|nr:DUF192 domain-containing protein [Selenomonadales bacterium]
MARAQGPTTHHLTVKRAGTFLARLVGLMFRAGMAPLGGLLLTPCRSVHTCFMRFPLDVVFLDADFRVVGVVLHLAPWRFTGHNPQAHHALELSVGEVARLGIRLGDTLHLQDSSS